jgi:hypothetical protein
MRRFLRGLGELAGEFLFDGALTLAAFGLVLLVRWGWSRHRASTVTLLAVLTGLAVYGVAAAVRRARGGGRRGPLAAAGLVVAVFVAVWLYYLVFLATA